jgi:integrase
MHLPLAKPLLNYLLSLPSTDNPKDFIFPKSAKVAQKRVGTLSNKFYGVLTSIGFAAVRSHEATKKGRRGGREVSELSFHSLRHSATTLLKAAGVSDVIAREIIGHESETVSRNYTHFDAEDLRDAIEKLPDVTKEKDAK